MTVLSVQAIEKSFGAHAVLRGASFVLGFGQRAGLVGPNGAGKSTLLRIVAGLDEPDRGQVALPGSARLGYVAQDALGRLTDSESESVWDVVCSGLAALNDQAERLRALERCMGDPAVVADPQLLQNVMDEYANVQARFEWAGGYERDVWVRQALHGLGFRDEQLQQPVHSLSGGQRVRLALARLLLSAPDVLVLDEPTNHLDLAAVEWLESYLRQFPGALLVVSHDRYFLDRVCDQTLMLVDGVCRRYRGNYSAAMAQRDAELAREAAEYTRLEAERQKLAAYVQRYRAGNRATQAKSRAKALARLQPGQRPQARQALRLNFRAARQSGEEVLILDNVGAAYGDRVIFQGISGAVSRGERLAIVGPNGAGKSTLLRILAGEQQPQSGTCLWGAGVELAYFAQDRVDLLDHRTVLAELMADSPLTQAEARDVLAAFLFRGDDVFKPVAALSGGERTRLALAKLVLSEANVLLLDEPTNHLDVEARTALETALAEYPGTLLIVSHDRYFLDRLATATLALDAGASVWHEGNWSSYRAVAAETAVEQRTADAGRQHAAAPHVQREAARARRRQLRSLQQRAAQAEARVSALEAEQASLEASLVDPANFDEETLPQLVTRYEAVQRDLALALQEWEEAALALSECESAAADRER